MKLTLEIKMDNAAFDDSPGAEAARILRYAADMVDLQEGGLGVREILRDINGNRVGDFTIEEVNR